MGQSLKGARKRPAEDEDETTTTDVSRSEVKGRDRRKEALSRKQLEKEKYRLGAARKTGNAQWSR
jgi:hypothetical protein